MMSREELFEMHESGLLFEMEVDKEYDHFIDEGDETIILVQKASTKKNRHRNNSTKRSRIKLTNLKGWNKVGKFITLNKGHYDREKSNQLAQKSPHNSRVVRVKRSK